MLVKEKIAGSFLTFLVDYKKIIVAGTVTFIEEL